MADFRENVLPVMVNAVFSEHCDPDNIQSATEIIVHNELFNIQKSGGLQDFISKTHSYLSGSKDRVTGLILLNQLVQQCNTEVFQQHSPTWLRLLLQILQSYAPSAVHRAACHLISQILQFSQHFTGLSKDISSTTLPQLIPLLLGAGPEWKQAAMRCVMACLQTFPGPMLAYKIKVENLVLNELEGNCCPKEAIQCLCHLVVCGGSGIQGVKHIDKWTNLCDKLMGSLHETLSALYEGLETRTESTGPTLGLKPLSSSQDRQCQYVHRWTLLSKCLQTFLGMEFHAVARIPADVIVKLICRCLSINRKMLLSRPTTERTTLALQLPVIHLGALNILKQLTLTCTTLLVPYCRVILGYLSQELLWTNWSEMQRNRKPYGALRSCIYEVLSVWLKVMDGCSGFSHEETVIIKEILHDLTPEKDSLKINQAVTATTSDGQVKKKHKGGNYEVSQGISSQRKIHTDANKRLVECGLEALYWIVTAVGPELERKSVQNIQEFIVKTVLLAQQSRVMPVPYGVPECRKGLYRVLLSCVLAPHPTAPPLIQCAVKCFSVGLQDRNLEVSSFCLEALRNCEVLIHPRAPCLNGPVVCENLVYIDDSKPKTTTFSSQSGTAEMNDTQPFKGYAHIVTSENEHKTFVYNDMVKSDIDSSKKTEDANKSSKNSESLSDLEKTPYKRNRKEQNEDDEGPSGPKYTKLKDSDDFNGFRNLSDLVNGGRTSEGLNSKNSPVELDDSSSDSVIGTTADSGQIIFDKEHKTSIEYAKATNDTASSPQPSTSKAGAIEIITDEDSGSVEEIAESSEDIVPDSTSRTHELRINDAEEENVNCEPEVQEPFITTDSEGNKEVLTAEPFIEHSSDEEVMIVKDLKAQETGDSVEDKAPSEEVEAMLMTFVDAGPDPE